MTFYLSFLLMMAAETPAPRPINLQQVLERPFVAPAAWGPGSPSGIDGDTHLYWQQRWFGLSVRAGYLLLPDGTLQSITLRAPACAPLEAALRAELGEPYRAGPSPQFLFSLRFARWLQAGIEYVLEDFAPGCEVSLYRR